MDAPDEAGPHEHHQELFPALAAAAEHGPLVALVDAVDVPERVLVFDVLRPQAELDPPRGRALQPVYELVRLGCGLQQRDGD